MERKYCNTRYGKISYLDRNEGYTVLFLHGFGGTGNTWLKSSPYMEKCIRPVLIDLLGHGHSDKPDIQYTIEQQAEAVFDVVHCLGINKFSIAGNSYGGWIAMKLASTIAEPDMLFLIDSAGISPALSEESKETMNRILDSILRARNYNNRSSLEKIMENNKRPEEKISDYELNSIRCPTTIIWGDRDSIIPVSFGHTLNSKISGSDMIIVNNAGHTPFIDSPEEVAGIINRKTREQGLC